MTDDTKRAIEITKPLADFCNLVISADDKYLTITARNGEAIRYPIEWNSTRATIRIIVRYISEVGASPAYKMWGCE